MFRGGRRHPNWRNRNPESQENGENTTVWRKLTERERTLVSVILVELSFLLVLFAIALAFYFPWSPWSHSEKCGVLCQEEACTKRGGSWRESILHESRNGRYEEADEGWAEIPEELHYFITRPPPFVVGEAQGDYDNNDNNIMTQTTSGGTVTETGRTITPPGGAITTGITTTTARTTTTLTTAMTTIEKCSNENPPAAILFKSSVSNGRLTYKCTAAVITSSFALVNNDGCIPPKDYNYDYNFNLGAIMRRSYTFPTGDFYVLKIETNKPNNNQQIIVLKIVTFKKLSALYFRDKYNEVDCWYGQYLTSYVTEEKANAFTWKTRTGMLVEDMEKEKVITVSVDLNGKASVPSSITSSPLLIVKNNRYYLAGFASKGKIMLNIYFGEYKKWLMKR